MSKDKKTMESFFKAKRERRKDLAKLPIQEKVKILVQMQKMALPILLARGIQKTAWEL